MAMILRSLTIASCIRTAQAAWAQAHAAECSASIVYAIDGQPAFDTWTRTTKLKCGAPGTWATVGPNPTLWTIRKTNRKQLGGSVTFPGVQPPGCAATWPLTGSITRRKKFTVTATDPTGANANCVKSITATATIK